MSRHMSWDELDRHAREIDEEIDRLAIEAHVHECSECTTSLRRLRHEEKTLRTALAPEVEEAEVERVAALVTANKPTAKLPVASKPARKWRASSLVPLAAAAAVIVAVTVATLRVQPVVPKSDPVDQALQGAAAGSKSYEKIVLQLGRKVLPDLRRAEAHAQGEARSRLASLRNEIEMSQPRVLWVEQVPRYIYRSLKPALLEDRGYVVQTLQLGVAKSETSSWLVQFPFPTEIRSFPAGDLQSYDVLLLGDLQTFGLKDAAEEFVLQYGGSVCMIGGEHSTAVTESLSGIAPVEIANAARPQQAYVRLTSVGLTHAAMNVAVPEPREEFFGSCGPLRWYQTVRVRPGATTLLETREGAPIVATWDIGRGRAAYVASDDQQLWRQDQRLAFYRAILGYLARKD